MWMADVSGRAREEIRRIKAGKNLLLRLGRRDQCAFATGRGQIDEIGLFVTKVRVQVQKRFSFPMCRPHVETERVMRGG